jgi:hypothetical protein
MFFLRERPDPPGSLRGRRLVTLVGFGLVSIALMAGFSSAVRAQSKGEKSPSQSQINESLDEKLKAVERERDDLRKRNAELELRLKQLQATVDNLVHQALREQPAPPVPIPPQPGRPTSGMLPPRPLGPFIGRFRPPFFPPSGAPDPVELAVAFSDAIGEKEAAKPALDAAKQKVQTAGGANRFDVDAALAQLSKAERKVQLLRRIVTAARQVAAEEAERMHKLGAAHVVSLAEVRNAEVRLKILDEILATDPEPAKRPTDSPRQPAAK